MILAKKFLLNTMIKKVSQKYLNWVYVAVIYYLNTCKPGLNSVNWLKKRNKSGIILLMVCKKG